MLQFARYGRMKLTATNAVVASLAGLLVLWVNLFPQTTTPEGFGVGPNASVATIVGLGLSMVIVAAGAVSSIGTTIFVSAVQRVRSRFSEWTLLLVAAIAGGMVWAATCLVFFLEVPAVCFAGFAALCISSLLAETFGAVRRLASGVEHG